MISEPPVDLTAPEPARSIYRTAWGRTSGRIPGARGPAGPLLEEMRVLVEGGWAHVRRLQHLYEREAAGARGDEAYTAWLDFIDGEVVDVYVGLAIDAAALVPGVEPAPESHADEVDGGISLFTRYLAVLRLAASDPAVPPDSARVAREVEAALAGWAQRLDEVVASIEQAADPGAAEPPAGPRIPSPAREHP